MYGWRSFSFDLPRGLEDESVLTFLARQGADVRFNVTLSRAPLAGPFESYLADAIADLKRSLPAYQLVTQTSRQVAGLDASVLEHTTTSSQGITLRQLQAYIANGSEVLIVTATGRDEERLACGDAFEHILGSFRAA